MPVKGTEAPSIVVRGLAASIKYMENIGGKGAVKAIKMANKEAAEPVFQEAKHLVPVRTGHLRDSIKIKSLLRRVQIVSGGRRVPYSNPIHWGWFYDKNWFIYKNIRPNPFLARALNTNREKVKQIYIQNVDKVLQNEIEAARLRSKVIDK